MKIQSILTAFHFAGFLLLLGFARPVFASSDIALADILDANGRIYNPNQWSGSVNFSGYYPVIDSCKGLVFLPQPPLTAGWNALGTGLNTFVHCIAVSGNGVYVGGEFTDAGGNPNADRIAYWDGSSWNALGTGANNLVSYIAISGTDVYIGGSFTSAGGVANTSRIARWDGSTWYPLGNGFNNAVHIIGLSGGSVYAGGLFTDAGGNANGDYIARWDGANWNPLGTGLNNGSQSMAFLGNDMYIGGYFTSAGGVSNTTYIARWDGSAWHSVGGGVNNWVIGITIDGSDIYVGGSFINAGGNANADYIARLNGNTWNALGTGLNNWVYEIYVLNSNVYVAGDFTNAGGNASADYIARWNGSTWDAFGNGVNGALRFLDISGNDLYVGGIFTSASGVANTTYIARYGNAALPVELLTFRAHPEEKQVLLDWRTASETDNLGWDIERSADGRQWQGIGFRAGKGTTSVAQSYTFTDEQPLSGQNYYRLRQSDHNGQYEYSSVMQVMMPTSEEQTGAFFPNPAHPGLVSLQYDAEKEGDLHVSVFDAHGRLMIHQNQPVAAARNLLQFDFSTLSPGTYAVLLDNGISQVTRTLTIQ